MKKGFFYLLLAGTLLSSASCNKTDLELEGPETYTFVTVKDSSAAPASIDGDQDAQGDIYFQTDDWETFSVSENKSGVDYTKLEDGKRVVVGVTLEESLVGEYDHTATLYQLFNVLVGECAEVTSDSANDAIADEEILAISESATLTFGFLNLYVAFSAEADADLNFYLVDKNIPVLTSNVVDKSEYLDLELRYDSDETQVGGDAFNSYLSFNVWPLVEKLENYKGINLRVKVADGEIKNIKIDSKDLFPTVG